MKPRTINTRFGDVIVVPRCWYDKVRDVIFHSVSYVYSTRRYNYYIDAQDFMWRCPSPFGSSVALRGFDVRVVPDDFDLSRFFVKE